MPELEPGDGPPVARARGSLGHALKKLLLRAEHSGRSIKVESLARRVNVSQASLYAYLSGKTLPRARALDLLLTELEVPDADRRWYRDLRDDIAVRFPARPKAGAADAGPPLIELMLVDGSVEVAEIVDGAGLPDEETTLAGPHVIEQLGERVHVDAHRTMHRVDFRRRIRATTAGVRRFSYAFECEPDSGLRRVIVESHDDTVVSKVIQVGRSSYVFHFDLPEPLDAGRTADLSFSLVTFENPSDQPGDIYGKRQFVATERVELSVEFAPEVAPAEVTWFIAAFPLGNFPDGFTFPAENVLTPEPDGSYQKTFTSTDLPEGRIVGLRWNYQK
ncbi:hypothetical protein GCM10009630_11390 [Kribbella jejuensis]|uniref:HTH cro/C1-type domain-containing protein n=1 Tax=Kribbella jejuensis TaxID=236068 RepID=A0A542E9Z7_9ACTN|nr:hypothetical protein FB475_5047 [Kribbella jejuensis]